MEPEFIPQHVKCKLCGDVIFSRYEREFVSCRCGAIAVDQTKYYSRYIGDPENFIQIQEEPDGA